MYWSTLRLFQHSAFNPLEEFGEQSTVWRWANGDASASDSSREMKRVEKNML